MDEERFRAMLLARRKELVAEGEATAADRRPVELDQTTQGRLSRMDAMQVQAMAVEAERRRQTEIRRIDAALARMEAGEYGCCVRCGEDIAERRLVLDPATPTCITCAGGR